MPAKERKQTSAAGRQDGNYRPPILAEPKGGPIPAAKKPDQRSVFDAELRWGVRKFSPNQPRDPDGEWSDGVFSTPDSAVFTVKVRTQEGSIHLSNQGGRLSIRLPTPDFDDAQLDTVTLDRSTAAELAEELQLIEEAGTEYNQRVKKLWGKASALNPDGGGDDDTDPASKAAWDAVGELAGDGQRITGGQLDTEDGAELHYELRMGDEPGDMDLLIAIRPPDAEEDWDIHAAAADAAGAFLSWSQMKKLRREVEALLADSPARSVQHGTRANQLKDYWLHGEGAAKWSTWTELYHHLVKYLPPERAKRTAAEWFHQRYGIWPGHQLGKNPKGPG